MKPNKTIKITLWGGFHNMPPINVRVDADKFNNCEYGIIDVLSDNQRKRLERYFCGMSDCCCGGLYRDVEWEVAE